MPATHVDRLDLHHEPSGSDPRPRCFHGPGTTPETGRPLHALRCNACTVRDPAARSCWRAPLTDEVR